MTNESSLLTPSELVELTGKRRYKAQQRVLSKMGVRHAVRPDGSPVVSRALVAAMLARFSETPPEPASAEPVLNLGALAGKRSRGG
jgi:hypothetical protein